jgi:hypothetical protein
MTETRTTASRALAIAGTVLVGLPLAAPIVLSVIALIATGELHVDFLLPGELSLVVHAGGVLLAVAALLTRRRRVSVILLTVLTAVLIGAVNLAPVLTGVGTGAGAPFGIVLGIYALYVAAVVALFVVGVLLCRDLFARPRVPAEG